MSRAGLALPWPAVSRGSWLVDASGNWQHQSPWVRAAASPEQGQGGEGLWACGAFGVLKGGGATVKVTVTVGRGS